MTELDRYSGVASIIMLSIVAMLCTAGVFGRLYRDNLLERVGMSMVGAWCIARVITKLHETTTEPVHLILHAGLLVFAVGIAFAKLRSYHGLQNRPRSLKSLMDGGPDSRLLDERHG